MCPRSNSIESGFVKSDVPFAQTFTEYPGSAGRAFSAPSEAKSGMDTRNRPSIQPSDFVFIIEAPPVERRISKDAEPHAPAAIRPRATSMRIKSNFPFEHLIFINHVTVL